MQAVKQNMNVVLAMLVGVMLIGLNGGLLYECYTWAAAPGSVYVLPLALNLAALAIALAAGRRAARWLERVQV